MGQWQRDLLIHQTVPSFQGQVSMASLGDKGRLERILIAAVVLEFLALSAIHLCAIPLHISMNYNEGWNAYFAQAAMGHGVLYPAFDAMATNNYPPLSFYIVGLVGKLIGDDIVAGRLIAMLSLAVVTLNVFRLGRWLGAERKLALLGAGVFLLGVYAVMADYIAIDDPQFLAYALVTSGALAFLHADEHRLWHGMLYAVVLMVLGAMVKHSEISLPLALCTWAVFYDRRRLVVFLICATVVGTAACGLAYAIWGQPMAAAMLQGHRVSVLVRAVVLTCQDLPFLLPYLVLAVVAAVVARQRRQAVLVLLYAGFGLFNGFWMLAGYGVNQNVMCDAIIALAWASVLFAMSFEGFRPTAAVLGNRAHLLAVLLMVLPAMGFSLFVYLTRPYLRDTGVLTDAPKWERLYKTLSTAHGEVACETLAVCYWARKPLTVDFFNYGQKLMTGSVYMDAPNGLWDKFNRQSYDYVVVEIRLLPHNRLPAVLMDTLFRNYQPVQNVAGTDLLLVPKPASTH
jgi:hypothetical protein